MVALEKIISDLDFTTTVVFRPTVQSRVTNAKKVLADELRLEIEVHRASRGLKV